MLFIQDPTVEPVDDSRWVIHGHPKYPDGVVGPDHPNYRDALLNRLIGFDTVAEVQAELDFYRSLTFIRSLGGLRIVGKTVYVGDEVKLCRLVAALAKKLRPKSKHRVSRSRSMKCKFIVSHGHKYGGDLRVGCPRDSVNASAALLPFLPALRECNDVRRAQQILDQGLPKNRLDTATAPR